MNALFLIFEKGNKHKHFAGFYNICKYTFFDIWKKHKQKKFVRGFFEICKYTFL